MKPKQIIGWMFSGIFILYLQNGAIAQQPKSVNQTSVRKIKDIIIYEDARFYSSFPSVVKGRNGEFLLAFRRAPDRKIFGEERTTHVDPNSYLMTVRSNDGEKWTKEPELLYAHPFGGSQDPCLLKLRDGTLLCTSYGWAFVLPSGVQNLTKPYHVVADNRAFFLGGYLLRSSDNGKTWQGPIYPPHLDQEIHYSALGKPLPAYNRGALFEDKSGRILWVVAANDKTPKRKISTHLLVSDDKGMTWQYLSPVAAADDKGSFSEASVYVTPKGDIVTFLRTAGMDDQACIARSTDWGKTFQWEKMGFQGHPFHALRLPDNRVLLTYGYRHEPYGIRARILNPECTDFKTAPEIVLREDGGSYDIGYPWSVRLDKNRVLIVYYFNIGEGTRHIAGTIIEMMR